MCIKLVLSAPCYTAILTEAEGCEQAKAVLWWEAGGEERLQNVVGEGESYDCLVGGVDHQNSNP